MSILSIETITERFPHILAECQKYLAKFPDCNFVHYPSGRFPERVKVKFIKEGRDFSFPINSFYRGPKGVQKPGISY